jgi:acyl-CoA thioester hydrolase
MSSAVFTWPIRVYWEDTDAGGIVFYANYLKFMERTRTEWLRALGFDQSALREQTGGIFVVSETTLKYHQPARLDDELLVTCRVLKKSRITVDFEQEIRCLRASRLRGVLSNDEQMTGHVHSPDSNLATLSHDLGALPLICAGTIRIAWVDAAALKPARMPEKILEVIR